MVVQYISSRESCVFGKRIDVPRRMNGEVFYYEIRGGDVLISEKNGERLALSQFEIPSDARSLEFDEMKIGDESVAGVARYYDGGGNLLKIGNR